mgnify:CR=1 FL=1
MKKGLLVFTGILIASALIYIAVCSYTYSDGTRSGVLIKYSHKGMVFKTYEGELNAGVLNTNMRGLTANLWNFSSMKNDSLVNQLILLEGHYVRLYYKEKLKTMPWQGETNYLVYKVEKLD